MRADAALPSAAGVGEALLLDEILLVTELDDGKIEHEKICSAARHGRDRARQHIDVRERVREYQHLRDHVFRYLREHQQQFAGRDVGVMLTICHRVGLAIDEAMREAINAFVEEHTGQLRHLSRTDGLTGLYNHRTFFERLGEELKRAARYETPLSVVLIDLDHFKAVNDGDGHQFGDLLLTKCADLLRRELRQTDVICRYGGDEFGVILPETALGDARAMMGRLSDAFRKLGRREGAPASFGMSFGLSAHPEGDGTPTCLVKAADERLLQNKRRNKRAARPGRE